MNEIIGKVINILGEIKEDPAAAEEYSGDSRIIEEIGLDSLEMINFVLTVEDEFGIEINFDQFDYSNLEDVKTFAQFIYECQKLQKKSVALA